MNTRTLLALAMLAPISGCETSTPANVVIENAYPHARRGAAAIVVHELWWSTALFDDPLAPGAESDRKRTVDGSDYAYAVLEVDRALIPIRSKKKLSVARGDTLHIDVSDATFTGRCDAGTPLAQRDADIITQRIFPGTFAGVHYDAATCAGTQRAPDAGGVAPNGASGEDADGGG
jgi:hypothetical protein